MTSMAEKNGCKDMENCGTIEKPVILRINATKSKSWW